MALDEREAQVGRECRVSWAGAGPVQSVGWLSQLRDASRPMHHDVIAFPELRYPPRFAQLWTREKRGKGHAAVPTKGQQYISTLLNANINLSVPLDSVLLEFISREIRRAFFGVYFLLKIPYLSFFF